VARPVVVIAPVIVTQPVGGTLGSGGSLTLSVVASGSGLGYQWKKDGVAIGGATGASYVAKAEGSYTVVVSNVGGAVTSGAAVVKAGVTEVNGMVLVKGGTLPSSSELKGQSVSDFWIGKYEVTWGEWKTVRDWAVGKGYDLAGVGEGSGDDHPVRNVSWYDVVKWCNARSEKEGWEAVYQVGGSVYWSGQSVPEVRAEANGYRLPMEVEWEWAARGGVSSKGYVYSGSNDFSQVGRCGAYFDPSQNVQVFMDPGHGSWPVGTRGGNELGIHDMSGNVSELQWLDNSGQVPTRGGSWNDWATDLAVELANKRILPNFASSEVGFRILRAKHY
jgi:sulfatase modifying factor 1